MHALKKSFLVLLFLALGLSSYAAEKVAKAIILKGKVTAIQNGKDVRLKKGMWLAEGAVVKTEPKSFVKFIFIDKSQMNLGPQSEMKIQSFPKKEAGIINLVKGQLRSKVTKDYMNIKDKNKSKLFIKTKSAAMGVRGTDFQVNYNPNNNSTSLITFSGAVALAQFTRPGEHNFNQKRLERIVSSDKAVIVKKGQFSAASPKTSRATIPVKISPIQLETLKNTESPGSGPKPASDDQSSAKPAPKFRSIVPPGVEAKTFANEGKEVDKQVAQTMGMAAVKKVDIEIKQDQGQFAPESNAPPEGMINRATGEIAPTAGGYIDLATAQYIPPPPGSAFDPITETYMPPPESGTIDPTTGDYHNAYYELKDDGSFEKRPDEEVAREISSTESNDQLKEDGIEEKPADAPTGETNLVDDGAAPPPPIAGSEPTMAETNITPIEYEYQSIEGQSGTSVEEELSATNAEELVDSEVTATPVHNNPDIQASGGGTTTKANFNFTIQ